jgi:hypothetical protein
MLFLGAILTLTTLLLCYAGYVFLIVDRRQEAQINENPELFTQLDEKAYDFDLPDKEIEEYEALRKSKPTDKRTLPVALLKRAMADIPRIEQLERDHPRMARLFNTGLLPFSIWEQLLEAEAMMDTEVHEVQAEAEKLQKGWGQGVFGQAYHTLREEREIEQQEERMRRDMATLTIEFTKPSGGVVKMIADGRNVTQQTQMAIRKECQAKDITFQTEINAELVIGSGDNERKYSCHIPEMTLDKDSDKPQWKQLGADSTALRLQVKFVRRVDGPKVSFGIGDLRATVPLPANDPLQAPSK